MKTVKTPAGIFTINKVKIPSAYTCAAEQKIEYISENHVQIITMNQAVSFGDQILSPRICPLPEIHEWYPHIKKARCNPCRNCGRC